MWLFFLACVMGGGEQSWSVEDPSAISVFLGNGDLTVRSSEDTTARIHWEGGGVGDNACPRVHQTDSQLVVDAEQGLLGGGELKVQANPTAILNLNVDRGSLDVRLSEATSVDACTGAGETLILLPEGGYNLDLDIGVGELSRQGIEDDPDSPYTIHACTGAGSVEIGVFQPEEEEAL